MQLGGHCIVYNPSVLVMLKGIRINIAATAQTQPNYVTTTPTRSCMVEVLKKKKKKR